MHVLAPVNRRARHAAAGFRLRHAANIIAKCGPEIRECAAYAQWFQRQYPVEWRSTTHVPNERKGMLDKIILAELGTKSGASDYVICVPRGRYSGLWIEAKRTGATWADVSPEQRLWLSLMGDAGFFPSIGYGIDHLREITRLYLSAGHNAALAAHHYGARISAKRQRKEAAA